MKKSVKRWSAWILSLLILLGTFDFTGLSVQAAGSAKKTAADYSEYGVVEVDDITSLRSAMENNQGLYIIVTKDISYTTERIRYGHPDRNDLASEQYEKWKTIQVGGNKVLDLNGHRVEVIDKSNWMKMVTDDCYTTKYGANGTFCKVPAGLELTINDSQGGGSVFYDGYMIGSNAPGAAGGKNLDYYIDICHRDLFSVEGSMVINGGTFHAGRTKKQFLVFGGFKYVEQLIWGTPVTVIDGGSVIINDGDFAGIGSDHVYDTYRGSVLNVWTHGQLKIFGGVFKGNWGADVIHYSAGKSDVEIYGGFFCVSEGSRNIRTSGSGGVNGNYDTGCGINIPGEASVYPFPVEFRGSVFTPAKHKLGKLGLQDVTEADIVEVKLTDAAMPSYLYQNGEPVKEIFYETGGNGTGSSVVNVVDKDGKPFAGLSALTQARGKGVEYGWTLSYYNEKKDKWYKMASFTDARMKGHENEPQLDIIKIAEKIQYGQVYRLNCTTHEYDQNGRERIYESEPIKLSKQKDTIKLIKSSDERYMEMTTGDSYQFKFSLYDIDQTGLNKDADPTWSAFFGYFDPSGEFHLMKEKEGLVGTEREREHGTSGDVLSLFSEKITFDQPGKYTIREAASVRATDLTSAPIAGYQPTVSIGYEMKDIVVEVGNPHEWLLLFDASTCLEAKDRYYICTNCYKLKSELGEIVPCQAGSTYYLDDSSCWKKCRWCEKEMEVQQHSWTTVSVDSDCDGNVAHLRCERCKAETTKEMISTPIEMSDVSILIAGPYVSGPHTWSTDGNHNGYSADSQYHWHFCKHCSTLEKKAHEWVNGVCKVCGIEQCSLGVVGTGCVHKGTLEVVLVADWDNEVSAEFKSGNVIYAWYRSGESTPFSTGKTANITAADQGKGIYCEVTFPIADTIWYADYAEPIAAPVYTDVAGSEATCARTGIAAHKLCTKCGGHFDANGNPIGSVVIPKTENHVYDNECDTECNVCGKTREVTHKAGTEWKSDENGHYQECTVCKARLNEGAHVIDEMTVEKDKKCDELRELTGTCTVCGEVIVETEVKSHVFGEWEIDPATCQKTGVERRVCTSCGETEEHEIMKTDHLIVVVPETLGSHDEPGRKAHYECAYCGEVFGDILGAPLTEDIELPASETDHDFKLTGDESGHYEACECGEKTAAEPHQFSDWELYGVTHMTDGYRTRICAVCGFMEIEEVKALTEHEFDWGYDRKYHFETCDCGETLEKERHTFEDGICTVCGMYKFDSTAVWVLKQWWFWLALVLLLGGSGAAVFFVLKRKKAKAADGSADGISAETQEGADKAQENPDEASEEIGESQETPEDNK